jgi:glycerol-3-phosphate acyltransferase PlsY
MPLEYSIAAAVVAYLLGSIPFGFLLVRLLKGEDVRATGSGNIGATNVARSGGTALGIATLALDALKGVAAVWIAVKLGHMVPPQSDIPGLAFPHNTQIELIGGLMAVVGHMFPIWLRFRGGKGVATAAGVFAVISPRAFLITLVAFLVAVAITRYVSLGSVVAAIVFPVAFWIAPISNPYFCDAIAAVISLLIIAKHHANIRRLLSGTESRLGGKRPA